MIKDTYYLKRILKECESDKKQISFTYEEILNDKTPEEIGLYVRNKMLQNIKSIEEYKTSIQKLLDESKH